VERLRRFAGLAIVTVGGAGCLPRAPGTFGSAVALVLLALFPSGPWYFPAVVGGVVVTSLACVALGRFGERQLGRKDPESFVLDEVAGMWLAAAALTRPPLHWCIAAFALFRYFDIKKPLGIKKLQKLPEGLGILLDDLAAGACALVIVQACQAITRGTFGP